MGKASGPFSRPAQKRNTASRASRSRNCEAGTRGERVRDRGRRESGLSYLTDPPSHPRTWTRFSHFSRDETERVEANALGQIPQWEPRSWGLNSSFSSSLHQSKPFRTTHLRSSCGHPDPRR